MIGKRASLSLAERGSAGKPFPSPYPDLTGQQGFRVRSPSPFRLTLFVSSRPRGEPSPYLTDPRFWQQRVEKLQGSTSSLLVVPRQDLSGPLAEVLEWRLRAHDGLRLRCLRALSPFHPKPQKAVIRVVSTPDLLIPDPSVLCEGWADVVLCLPQERRLEDRVLDLLRVYQLVASALHLDPGDIQLGPPPESPPPDDLLIARQLLAQGLLRSA